MNTPSLVYFRDFLTLQDPNAKPITTVAGILRDGILMDNYNLQHEFEEINIDTQKKIKKKERKAETRPNHKRGSESSISLEASCSVAGRC